MPGQWDGKPCVRCGRRKTPRRRLEKHCATCHREISAIAARRAHDLYLRRTYGITVEEYEQIVEYQGGKCYICRRATGKTRRLSVDHDHKKGSGRQSVRGILCRPCNNFLGHFRDNPEIFARAIDYLASPPAHRVISRDRATMESPG
jgi:hypothetical protein